MKVYVLLNAVPNVKINLYNHIYHFILLRHRILLFDIECEY